MSEEFEFPPRLTLERRSVLNLFRGDTFYSSADAALREALLNSIDAVARRRVTDEQLPPAITVEFKSDPLRLVVADNGTGMTRAELATLFSRVGASASKLMAASQSNRMHMIGEFGIGVMSYFLLGDHFDVDTKASSEDAVALRFLRSMIDDDGQAEIIPSSRTEIGTTLTLSVDDRAKMDLLLAKFQHWVRDVEGLQGFDLAGAPLMQGGLSREVLPVHVDHPEWVFESTLGPPADSRAWETFDGKAHIDILYSGIFVERLEIPQLWGIEGSVHVDPKRFRPKLNREGFVGNRLQDELHPFLLAMHPAALARAAESLPSILSNSDVWTASRAATIWMALPRGGTYAAAARAWDEVFRAHRVIRQLLPNDQDRLVSVNDLVAGAYSEIYVAPLNLGSQPPVVRAAVRLLRDEGAIVVVGIERDSAYLQAAAFAYGSTETMLAGHFAAELPKLTHVHAVADTVLERESLVDVCLFPVPVRLVQIGPEASAVLIARNEIWINAAVPGGKDVARHLCANPYGLSSLLAACLAHAPDQIQAVANLIRGHPEDCFSVGPVRRQLIQQRVL